MPDSRTRKNFSWHFAILLAALALIASLGCGLSEQIVALVRPPTPIATAIAPATSTLIATATATFASTPRPPSTPTLTPTRLSTPTPTATPNLTDAKIGLQDLPNGFVQMPPPDPQNTGEGNTTSAGLAKYTNARRSNIVSFVKPPQNLELVVSYIMYPISGPEAAAFDDAMLNPESFMNQVASGISASGGPVRVLGILPGADRFGDRSMGFTLVPTDPSNMIKFETVVTRRGSVVEVVNYVYDQKTNPTAKTVDLARALDSRVAALLGK